MQVRRVVAVATLAVLAAGAHMPAMAAKKAPIKKSYDMRLAPFPNAAGDNSCEDDQLIGIVTHQEIVKTTGPGLLTVKVNGFYGDWDITVYDGDHEIIGAGDGTSTPNTNPAAGEDTFTTKLKKATTLDIRTCNFAGSPSAHGEFTFQPK